MTPEQIGGGAAIRHDDALADLLSSLGNRIGFDRVLRLLPAESLIPDRSYLVIFPPEPVTSASGTPPASFRWRRMRFTTPQASGPERITPEWWLDDPAWRSGLRDHWRIETSEDPRLWLFLTPQAQRWSGAETQSRADAIGVFQVESRAQLNFLPRMRPRGFYDLVCEIAIVRPGPIQGGMVHPFINRRMGREKVEDLGPALMEVLARTYGVPLFQEQAMQIAVVAAGFTPSEADRLRRSLVTFKRMGTIGSFRDRFVSGMLARGYDADFAARCFAQIEGFGSYGFPESHAASFARLVYISAWLKCHHQAVFTCALLNSQPMGFYAPAQLVRDARDHGVEVRPISVNHSVWDCTLEPRPDGALALRLGFRQIKGMREEDANWIAAARGNGYPDVESLWRRAGVPPDTLERLAESDAFAALGLTRRDALWAAKALKAPAPLPLFGPDGEGGIEPAVTLRR